MRQAERLRQVRNATPNTPAPHGTSAHTNTHTRAFYSRAARSGWDDPSRECSLSPRREPCSEMPLVCLPCALRSDPFGVPLQKRIKEEV